MCIFRTPITIRSHNLHADNIRGALSEIASYIRETSSLPFFWVPAGCASFGLSLAFPFCFPSHGSDHWSFIGFLWGRHVHGGHDTNMGCFTHIWISQIWSDFEYWHAPQG
jgi:hypothetical protein